MRSELVGRSVLAGILACAASGMVGGCNGGSKPLITDEYPKVELANQQVRMAIYLPDAEKSYYRGVRFDWSGMIVLATYKGHTFFGQKVSGPDTGRFAMGPCEEFRDKNDTSYNEVEPGGEFVKIGVGILQRRDKSEYSSLRYYEPIRFGTWEVEHGDDWITFHQDLTGPRGWAYSYTKRVALTKDRAGFTIWHRLKNTGTKRIETWFYNHNFVILDGQETYPDYRVKLPFAPPKPQVLKDGNTQTIPMALFSGKEIVLTGDPGSEWILAMDLDGMKETVEHNDILFDNRKTGASLRATGDLPVKRMVYYATKYVVSVEPYVEIELAPGEQKDWSFDYTFMVDGDEAE